MNFVFLKKRNFKMEYKRIRKDVTEFYQALNEFFDWLDEKESESLKEIDRAFGMPNGKYQPTPVGLVGEFPDFKDETLLPADREAEMIPTLDEKEDIRKALRDGIPFNVEILYGELLRDAFAYERTFRYRGTIEVTPFICGNAFKCGFDLVWLGDTISTFEFEDYYPDEKSKVLQKMDWEQLANDIMTETEE